MTTDQRTAFPPLHEVWQPHERKDYEHDQFNLAHRVRSFLGRVFMG